ncbi:MAG TPA: restriction endonuclease subunit S [Salinimicrobium sp.]|nr:restriction endonuclease subunit S [Salinimicrobium sp.]
MRFPGFETAWEKKSVGKVISIKSDKYNPDTDESEFSCIELESLSQGTGELLLTFSSKNQKSTKNVFNSGDVLFGKLRPYLRKFYLVDFKGVCSSEIWVMNSTVFNPLYLYAYVQSNRFLSLTEITSGSKMPRADWNLISASVIRYPKEFKEREKIGDLFRLVNERIHTQSQIIKNLQSLMLGLRQRIFSQQLRFKDDEENEFPEWTKVRLDNLTSKTDKKNKQNIQYPIYSINNKEGFLPQSEQFEGMDSNERGYDISLYKVINKNTFAYNPARINVGSIGYSGDLENIIISSLYVCFKTKDLLEDKYLRQYLNTFQFNKDVLRYSEGGVRQYLFFENFSKIKIPLPAIKEQTKIANFLSALDEKMEREKEILAQYRQQKKYLLHNVFI